MGSGTMQQRCGEVVGRRDVEAGLWCGGGARRRDSEVVGRQRNCGVAGRRHARCQTLYQFKRPLTYGRDTIALDESVAAQG